MPVFDLKYSGKYEDEQGIEKEIPSETVLFQEGPKVRVSIEITGFLRDMLNEQGAKIPGAIPGVALIDTGATATSIDNDCARNLHLPIIGTQVIATPSHEQYETPVYSHGLISLVGTSIAFNGLRLIGVPLKNQGIQVLFGRDFLRHGILIYHGASGSISFAL